MMWHRLVENWGGGSLISSYVSDFLVWRIASGILRCIGHKQGMPRRQLRSQNLGKGHGDARAAADVQQAGGTVNFWRVDHVVAVDVRHVWTWVQYGIYRYGVFMCN